MPKLAGRGIAGLRGEEADRAVAPVVQQQLAGLGVLRLFSNSSNSKIGSSSRQLMPSVFEIRDLLANAGEGAGEPTPEDGLRSEAAHMRLVDDQVFDRCFQRPIAFPVEVVERQTGAVLEDVVPVRFCAPHVAAANGPRIGIEQDLGRIEAVPALFGSHGPSMR